MNALTRRLIAKDFYLQRWLIAIAIVGGLASLAIAAEGAMRFNIGVLAWITTMISFGIMVAMLGVVTERKERAQLFVLSLPLSHGDYVRIKLLALLAIYIPGWLVLSAGAVTLVLVMPNLPDGLIPYTVLLSVFFLANFSLVLCGALHTASEGLMTAIIVVTNMGVSLFIFLVGSIAPIRDHFHDPTPVWNDAFWTVLAVELVVFALALCLPHLFAARRRDFT
jgi:ABC-2 type transport system permease protein